MSAVEAGSLGCRPPARHAAGDRQPQGFELEAHLRTRLNRSSRRLTLTDAGRNYVAACKRILEEVGEAERAASGEYSAPKGDLIITAPIVFGRLHVLPVMAEFLETYPEINIRMVLADRVVNLVEEHDLAVRIGELPTAAWSRPGSARSAAWFAGAPAISPRAARRTVPLSSPPMKS